MYILSQKPLALFAACAFKTCVPASVVLFLQQHDKILLKYRGQSYKEKYNYS